MKKLSILLIGLLLVTGFAIGQEWAPSLSFSGSATVTFGVNLDTNATGFVNAESSSFTIELVASTDVTKGGDDGLYGEITINDLAASVGAAPTVGDVTAKIVISPIEIIIENAPDMAFGNVAILDVNNDDIGPVVNHARTLGGITIVVPIDPITINLGVASDGDWLTEPNVNNDYAVSLEATVAIDPLTIDLGLLYGMLEVPNIGVTANVAVALADVVKGLDLAVGFDGLMPDGGTLAWEVDFETTLNISDANADDAQSNVALAVSYSEDEDLDLQLGYTELSGDDGNVAGLGAGVAVGVNDLLSDVAPMTFDIAVDIDYSVNGITPYAGFTYQSVDDLVTAKAGVGLGSDLTGIDNTAIAIDWSSDDLTDAGGPAGSLLGILTVAVTVSY